MLRRTREMLDCRTASFIVVLLVVVEAVVIFIEMLLDIGIHAAFHSLDCVEPDFGDTVNVTVSAVDWNVVGEVVKRPVFCISTTLLSILLVEVFARCVVHVKELTSRPGLLMDAAATLTSFALSLVLLTRYSTTEEQLAQFIILLRLWRVLLFFEPCRKGSTGRAFSDGHPDRLGAAKRTEMYLPPELIETGKRMTGQEQSTATLMLRVEELEMEIERLQSIQRQLLENAAKQKPVCQRCVNHSWTTEELLTMACAKLSRSESRTRSGGEVVLPVRTAKSLDDLTLPESGYSSTSMRRNDKHPRVDQAHTTKPPEWMTELMEIQRVARMPCKPSSESGPLPMTSL